MIIGLIGSSGGGKSAVASILEKNCGFKRLAFGEYIRREVGEFMESNEPPMDYRMPLELKAILSLANYCHVHPTALWSKPTPLWVRRVLQLWGTEFRRHHMCGEYWCNQLAPELKTTQPVVIEDCRFEEEIDMVHRFGGWVVDVNSGELPADLMQHSSETLYIDNRAKWRDYVLLNPKHTGLDWLLVHVDLMLDGITSVEEGRSRNATTTKDQA